MNKDRIHEAMKVMWKYGDKHKLKFDEWLLILECMKIHITRQWVMQDFNKDGDYVINLKQGDVTAEMKASKTTKGKDNAK